MITKTYNYQKSDGSLLFQVVRLEPKDFRQRRPYQNVFAWGLTAGWYKKDLYGDDYFKLKDASEDKNSPPSTPATVWLDAVDLVLYRLPELLEGIKNERTIFITEGEKDADNLAALGFIATTCPMGAGKWQSNYTETLAECREVVIVADNDEPGRNHAEAVARDLYSAGIPVKILGLPDIKGLPIKDLSDWLNAGGNRNIFLTLIEECANYVPPQHEPPASPQPELQDLIHKYGEPYYVDPKGKITSINQTFWASLYNTEHIQLFEPDERAFYRYNPENGLYSVVSEDLIKQEIAARMLEVSRQNNSPQLEQKRNNTALSNIVAQLRGVSERRGAFSRDKKIVHLANGVIVFNDNADSDFCEFSPSFYSRNQCPIPFDESAKCDRFLNEFLYPAVSPEDATLLQKYAGLCLLGNNLIQRFLILDGKPGRGKSTFALILQKLVGQENVTELRTKHLNERFELFRYRNKNLLVGVDTPGWFLSTKGAAVIKGLVGGDWFDAEQKGGTGSFQFRGNFCIAITSNSRLHVCLDGDTEAWRRRLLIIRFEAEPPVKKIPHLADVLIQEEGSGILNWALQGLGMLLKDVQDRGDILMTAAQEKIVDGLLSESDSLRKFLVDTVMKHEKTDVSTDEIEAAYGDYCSAKGWTLKPIRNIHLELGGLMLELFQSPRSGSICRDGKFVKGFRGVMLDTENTIDGQGEDTGKQPWEE